MLAEAAKKINPSVLRGFKVSTLRTKDVEKETNNGSQVLNFKSARLDKFFKNIHPDLCLEVSVFNSTFNITYWYYNRANSERTSSKMVRVQYSRKYDDDLGVILFATYMNLLAAQNANTSS